MYKDSCCAQATMQSVNAFSRETLAASASCQAGRNKVYQKREKRETFRLFFPIFPLLFGQRESEGHSRRGSDFQEVPLTQIWVVGALNVPHPSHFLQQSHMITNIKQHMIRNTERVTKATPVIDQKKIKQQNVGSDFRRSHKTRKNLERQNWHQQNKDICWFYIPNLE